MDKTKAKKILLFYRPGLQENEDPEVREALLLTKEDPDLNGWFEGQQRFHKAARDSFRQIEVPAGLAEQIISEAPTGRSRDYRSNRLMASLVLASAIFAVLLVLVWHRPGGTDRADLANFQLRMARRVSREYPVMDLQTNNLTVLLTYLGDGKAANKLSVPQALHHTEPTGCARISWQGHPVSMICFSTQASPGSATRSPDLYLFVVKSRNVQGAKLPARPVLNELSGLSTVTWTDETNIYLLAGKGGTNFVAQYAR